MPAKRKQTGRGIPQDIFNFVKDHKLISSGLGLIPHPGAQVASVIAKQLGLGKKRRAPKKRQTGGSIMSAGVGSYADNHRSLLPLIGRGQVGGGIFGDLGSGIGSVFGGLGSGVGSIAHGLFGGAKKRVVRHRAIKI